MNQNTHERQNRMNKTYYYHLTTPENAEIIMKNGLKPMLGENAKSIKDVKPALCLCTEKSVDAWAILLGVNTVIKLTVPSENKLEQITDCHCTDEFHYGETIPAKYLIESYTIEPSKDILNELRSDYIMSLSRFCELCARYYTEGTGWKDGGELQEEIEEDIEMYGNALIPVIPRLNYPEMNRQDIQNELRMFGDSGAYTFCDEYVIYYDKKPTKRLYQMLIEYPDDKFTELRKSVYKLIKENFKYCLRTNTGGWTG